MKDNDPDKSPFDYKAKVNMRLVIGLAILILAFIALVIYLGNHF